MTAAAAADPPVLSVPRWDARLPVAHGFFGREGGASTGPFRSLNVSGRVGHDPAAVAENWRRVGARMNGLTWIRMQQVHGARVALVGGAAAAAVGEADALLTTTPGLGLAVLTADCVPILAVAPNAGAVLAIHAGWRGTLAGIAVAGIETARRELGVPPIAWEIAIGPAIGGCCYEVEQRIGDDLVRRWGAMPDAWQPAGSHGQLDLRLVNRQQLVDAGVDTSSMAMVGPCTACRHDAYFSHRRSGGRTGRHLSAIALVSGRA
jgi:YfiH family protein